MEKIFPLDSLKDLNVKPRDLRATWPQALLTLALPFLLLMTTRWLFVEPFVIPSGSMIPSLLVHDHIIVNKIHFGVKVPFGKNFIWRWGVPQSGDVVVFRYPENPEVYFVKRVIGLPGDEVSMDQGVISINGTPIEQKQNKSIGIDQNDQDFEYFQERQYLVRYRDRDSADFFPVVVPENSFFVMGDNRDQSRDSRSWGFVPYDFLVGKAFAVWLSCEKTFEATPVLCDPQTIRWNRIFSKIK